jgi:hypothetical protein
LERAVLDVDRVSIRCTLFRLTENFVFLIFCQYKDAFLWFLCLQDIKWMCYRVDNHADKESGNPSAAFFGCNVREI